MSRLERLYSPPEIGAPGKRDARSRRRVLFFSGLFVLSMAAVVVAVLTLVIPGLVSGSYRLLAYFWDADGLDGGIQVIQDGYVVGIVESVTPVFPGRDPDAVECPRLPDTAPPRSALRPCFRVALRIRDRWPIPEDTRARLGSAGLLAGDAVKLEPGVSSRLLADGEVIGVRSRELDVLAQLSELSDTIERVVKDTVTPALESIHVQIQTIETLLGTSGDQDENRDRLAGAFESLNRLAAGMEEAIDPQQVAAILASLESVSAQMEQVAAGLPQTGGAVQSAVKEYGALAKEIQGLVSDNKPALERSLDDTQYLLQELSAALEPILRNIEDATRNLSALSRDLRTDPAVILKGREVQEETPWFR